MTKLAREGAAELVGDFEHDSPEWHAARADVVGSSDVAAILGLSPYRSAYTLWHEKRGLIAKPVPDRITKRRYAYGHFMEPFVAGLWEEEHDPRLLIPTGSWRNVERPWQGCNPDRLIIGGHGLVELKTFPTPDDWETPPPGYVAQVKWQLDTFGFEEGYLAGYANMSGAYVEHLIRHDEFEASITRDAVRAFLDSDTPPEIDGSESTYETIRKLNPSLNRGAEAEIPAWIAEEYLNAAAEEKAATSELLRWKGHLLAHMGTAQWAIYEDRRIASRVAARAGSVPYLKEQ